MPYMLSKDKMCVHKKNADGSLGEKVKCHPTEEKARAHMTALSMNVEEASKYAREFVPGYKSILDAPDLRGANERRCSNCNFFKFMPPMGYEMMDEQGVCQKHEFLTGGSWVCDTWKEFVLGDAVKAFFRPVAVKVAGDWELEVNGNPYGPDSDRQWFDENSQIVSGSDIPVIYYHSLEDTKNGPALGGEPIVIGKASNPTRKWDGVWWKVVLDKTVKEAHTVWDAARKGLAVASSGAIDYLSRLEINGKLIPYDKRRPGRIAIWHMGELSLWELGGGHASQAHPHAIAVPALKAIYKTAGIPFPAPDDSNGAEAPGRARRAELEKLHQFADDMSAYIKRL